MNYQLETDSGDHFILTNAVKLIKDIPGIICELGTRRGGSLKTIVEGLLENEDVNRNVVGVDPYGNINYQSKEDVYSKLDYTNTMRNEAMCALYNFICYKPINLVMFHLEDAEFFDRFADGVPFYNQEKQILNEYAFVYFDGPHSTDLVLKEMLFFQPRSPKGSVWVFDDVSGYYPHDEETEQWLFANGWELLEKTSQKASYKKL
jgi:hypothetical protein